MSWFAWPRQQTKAEKVEAYVRKNQNYFIGGSIATVLLVLSRPRFWRRIPDADSIPVSYWKKHKTITGVVTRVGDGDGFHLYHRVSKKKKTF